MLLSINSRSSLVGGVLNAPPTADSEMYTALIEQAHLLVKEAISCLNAGIDLLLAEPKSIT